MLDKERITIDITSESIAILIGSRFKIDHCAVIETPQGSFEHDEIIDVDKLKAVIMPHLESVKSRKKVKDLYFVVRGEDLILRQITLPQMKDEALKDSVQWELGQVVGDRVDEYYVDYEVVGRKAEGQDQNLDVLMVGTNRDKVNKYIDLGKELGFKIKIIDMCASLTARLTRSVQGMFKNGVKSVGILDVGADYSGFSIVEKGKLMHYKYQNRGIKSISDDAYMSNLEYKAFLDKIDLNVEGIEDLTDGKAENYFNSLAFNYNSIIQFYSTGKVKKTLDKIYILGSGKNITGLKTFIEESFNTHVEFIPEFEELTFSVKTAKKIKLNDVFYAYALMLKQDEKEMNLLPKDQVIEFRKGKKNQSALLIAILSVIVMLGGLGGMIGYKIHLEKEVTRLEDEIKKSQQFIDKELELDKEIALIKEHLEIAKNVDTLKSKGTKEFIQRLNSLVPQEIKFTDFEYKINNTMIIKGESTNQGIVEELYANLREDKGFKKSFLKNTTKESDEGIYTFELEIDLKETEEVSSIVETK